jgi:saccharopine dehydrogenase (NADP+, L-glutamate forming)/spermidine synthase
VSRSILVLGGGRIAPPLVRYLLARTPHRVLVAARELSRVLPILDEYPRGRAVEMDVEDEARLAEMIREADIVVSLLPASYSPAIARRSLDKRIPFVNTSYLADETRALDERARRDGVLLLAEIGLDPGLDHMSAVRTIRRIKARGGRVESVQSVCGGFPAPDANDNPWGYKFSWFPRAVLAAGTRAARFRRRGETVSIPPADLFSHSWPQPVAGCGIFEVFPNRDALLYEEAYGVPEASGLFRGTLRYPGWCATMRAASRLGLLDEEERDWPDGTTYRDLSTRLVGPPRTVSLEEVAEHLGLPPDSEILARLEWAGLLSDRPVARRRAAPLDLFAARLEKLMTYRPGERDMVAMELRFRAVFPDGHSESRTNTLVAVGQRWGDSAMARTVSLPAAIATRLILEGAIEAVGAQIPVLPEIYTPVLDELAEKGVALEERHDADFAGPLD